MPSSTRAQQVGSGRSAAGRLSVAAGQIDGDRQPQLSMVGSEHGRYAPRPGARPDQASRAAQLLRHAVAPAWPGCTAILQLTGKPAASTGALPPAAFFHADKGRMVPQIYPVLQMRESVSRLPPAPDLHRKRRLLPVCPSGPSTNSSRAICPRLALAQTSSCAAPREQQIAPSKQQGVLVGKQALDPAVSASSVPMLVLAERQASRTCACKSPAVCTWLPCRHALAQPPVLLELPACAGTGLS